jgi:hypothetical protein
MLFRQLQSVKAFDWLRATKSGSSAGYEPLNAGLLAEVDDTAHEKGRWTTETSSSWMFACTYILCILSALTAVLLSTSSSHSTQVKLEDLPYRSTYIGLERVLNKTHPGPFALKDSYPLEMARCIRGSAIDASLADENYTSPFDIEITGQVSRVMN